MLVFFNTYNVVFDGRLHQFDNGHGKGYVAERAVLQGVATYVDDSKKITQSPRQIITTRERGFQELARMVEHDSTLPLL